MMRVAHRPAAATGAMNSAMYTQSKNVSAPLITQTYQIPGL